jgi:hypothetical protein
MPLNFFRAVRRGSQPPPLAVPPGASLWLSLLTTSMDSLDAMLDSPPGFTDSRQPATPPHDHSLDEQLESPFWAPAPSSLKRAPEDCVLEQPARVHRDNSTVSKKLCLDGAVAPVASQPSELPVELVCLILGVLFVDDIGNKNSSIGAVSRMWRDATGLLADTWSQDLRSTPLLVSPFVVMRRAGSMMRDALEGTWSCAFPGEKVFSRRHIREVLSPTGWLFDDTIVLFFNYILGVPSLHVAIREAKSFHTRGKLDEWPCPRAVLLEPFLIESFRVPSRRNAAADLFVKDSDFGEVLATLLLEVDIVYAPICVANSHWILAVVWLRTGIVEVYDSMGGIHHRAANLLICFLDRMCRRRMHSSVVNALGIDGWDVIQHSGSSPQQTDCAACGVFACVTAVCISSGQPVAFSHREVAHWRLRIAFLLTTSCAAVTIAAAPARQERVVPLLEDPDGALVILSDPEG